jgi:branched-chain amino acid transport system permease protein
MSKRGDVAVVVSDEATTAAARPSARPRSLVINGAPLLFACVVLLVLPLFAPSAIQALATKLLIYSIFAVSLNILWGYTNMTAFGHAAFFGCAAYLVAVLAVHLGFANFWLSLLAAVGFTAVMAAILGIPALRAFPVGTGAANPMYFVLVTIGFGELLARVAMSLRTFAGGTNGMANIPYPTLGFGLKLKATGYYYLVFVVAVVCIYLMYRIVHSHFGYGLRGISHNERRMQALGYNTWLYKYTSWIIAAAFGGVSGALMAYFSGVVTPASFQMHTTFIAFLGVVVGGSRVFMGPVAGILVFVGVEYFASMYLPGRWPLILGAVMVLSLMLQPDGIAVGISKLWKRWFHGAP